MGYVFKVDYEETDIQEFKDKLAEAGCEWDVASFIALANKFRSW